MELSDKYYFIRCTIAVAKCLLLFERPHVTKTQLLKRYRKQTWMNITATNIKNDIGVFTISQLNNCKQVSKHFLEIPGWDRCRGKIDKKNY